MLCIGAGRCRLPPVCPTCRSQQVGQRVMPDFVSSVEASRLLRVQPTPRLSPSCRQVTPPRTRGSNRATHDAGTAGSPSCSSRGPGTGRGSLVRTREPDRPERRARAGGRTHRVGCAQPAVEPAVRLDHQPLRAAHAAGAVVLCFKHVGASSDDAAVCTAAQRTSGARSSRTFTECGSRFGTPSTSDCFLRGFWSRRDSCLGPIDPLPEAVAHCRRTLDSCGQGRWLRVRRQVIVGRRPTTGLGMNKPLSRVRCNPWSRRRLFLERSMIRAFAFVAALAFGAVPAQAANLLTNPGFEIDDLTGWTTSGRVWSIPCASTPRHAHLEVPFALPL